MGSISRFSIQKAADHLLRVLLEQKTVRYSESYYDGSDEQESRLVEEMGLDPSLGSWGPSPAILIDQAVWQLENLGWVEVDELDDRLCDGEQDYSIELTRLGRRELVNGVSFEAEDQVL